MICVSMTGDYSSRDAHSAMGRPVSVNLAFAAGYVASKAPWGAVSSR